MAIKVKQTKFKTLRMGDPGFALTDGVIYMNRAGFEISQACPVQVRQVIEDAIRTGYLRPVAHVYDTELTMDLLRQV